MAYLGAPLVTLGSVVGVSLVSKIKVKDKNYKIKCLSCSEVNHVFEKYIHN